MSKIYLVGFGVPNPENQGAMKSYLEKSTPLLIKAGGKYVIRSKVTKVLIVNVFV